ncbi:hypothetical protein BC938DRAFT_480715 [Jimgerdemannia flammicorona]|uniref:Uncharacterized protein n=1 Tax=Jimgerdemannia flammicorona TaxID=994334 RepID=A0A433QHU0_9FUNG|nr:hypothetical protein BC938DRAFT_480715 [Jimgerdemannia flammicorona]
MLALVIAFVEPNAFSGTRLARGYALRNAGCRGQVPRTGASRTKRVSNFVIAYCGSSSTERFFRKLLFSSSMPPTVPSRANSSPGGAARNTMSAAPRWMQA